MNPIVDDDMDRAIAFHMELEHVQQDELEEVAGEQQDAIEGIVNGFVGRARALDHLQPLREYVESLERQVVVLQDVTLKLMAPIQKTEQDLAARKALHARLLQALNDLNQRLRKAQKSPFGAITYNPGGRRK
jgi:hypothetical protein